MPATETHPTDAAAPAVGSASTAGPGRAAGSVGSASAASAASSARPVGPANAGRRHIKRRPLGLVLVLMALLLLVLVTVSAAVGQFGIAPADIVASIMRKLGLASLTDPSQQYVDGALWNIRFPRLMLGIMVGAALGVAGAMMQGVFGNPLAEPGVIGVSAGCAVGASAVIVFQLDFAGTASIPIAAFIMGLLTTFVVYMASRSGGKAQVLTLVLTGIAINAVANAIIAYFVFMADTSSREQITFWQLGSLNGATWAAVATTVPFLVIGLVGAVLMARKLDLLALGERSARHLGVNVERLRLWAILCVALLTAAAVAFAGIISFVGLIIPHLLRMLIGPSHKALIPASALGGALLVSGADVIARTAIPFADLPIGMFTALVGGPVFFVLLRRTLAPLKAGR